MIFDGTLNESNKVFNILTSINRRRHNCQLLNMLITLKIQYDYEIGRLKTK